MANPAAAILADVRARYPFAQVTERGPSHIRCLLETLPDGQRRYASISLVGGGNPNAGALHYRDNLGQWVECDDAFDDDGLDGFTVRSRMGNFLLRMDGAGKRRIYPDRHDLSRYIELSGLPGLGAPTRGENFLFWNRPNFSVRLQNQTAAIKLDIVLKNAAAPTSFSFNATLVGLTRSGNQILSQGVPVLEFRLPYAVDANKVYRDCTWSIVGNTITLGLDTAGLAFPIKVDPSVNPQVGTGNDDGRHIVNPHTWSRNLVDHAVGNYSSGAYGYAMWARFTGGPAQGSTITASYLQCYGEAVAVYTAIPDNTKIDFANADDQASPTSSAEYDAITWTGSPVTFTQSAFNNSAWNNVPDSGNINGPIQTVVNRAGYSGTLLCRWYDDNGWVAQEWLNFTAYEGSTSNCPKLYIEYTLPGVTLTAALSFAGIAQKQNQQHEAGALSFAGVTVKSVRETLASALSFSGSLTSQIISGTLAITLTAALSFAGAVTKTTSLALSGASSFSGTLGQQGQKVVSGVLSFGGVIGKAVSATTSSALSFGGAITKATTTSLAGALSFGGDLAKRGSLLLGGVASFAGSIGQGVATTVSAALSFGGEVVKQPLLIFPAALSFAGTVSKATTATLSSALSFTGNLAKTGYRNLSGALGFEGVLGIGGALLTVTLEAALSFAGAVTKATSKTVDASVSFGGVITKTVSQTLVGVLSWVGDFAKWVTRHGNPTVTLSNTAVATLTLSNSAVATLSLSNAAVATLTVSNEAWA